MKGRKKQRSYLLSQTFFCLSMLAPKQEALPTTLSISRLSRSLSFPALAYLRMLSGWLNHFGTWPTRTTQGF